MEHSRTIRVALEQIAFYAYMESNEHNPSKHHGIIFNHVKTNEGHGYSELSGASQPQTLVCIFSHGPFTRDVTD